MTQVIDILKNERECVVRADAGCDRLCDKCELVRPTQEILNAYDKAIAFIESVSK